MKVTISTNKFFERKPNANEIGKELSDAVFETIDIKPSDFSTIVEKGCVLSCNCNSVKYDYHYDKKSNYKGIQFVLIDVDECDLSIDEILNRMKYKPTVFHSSYSHLKENKQFLSCYHLYFFLDEEIEGIENYTKLFDIFSEGIEDILDCKVKCPQRIVFTNFKNNDNFEYHFDDIIYKVKDFLDTNQNELRNLNDILNWTKNDSTHILYNRYNICDESKNVQVDNHYNIDDDFFNDLNSLKRSELVDKYFPIYPFLRESEYKIDNTKSYIDLRNQGGHKHRCRCHQRRVWSAEREELPCALRSRDPLRGQRSGDGQEPPRRQLCEGFAPGRHRQGGSQERCGRR